MSVNIRDVLEESIKVSKNLKGDIVITIILFLILSIFGYAQAMLMKNFIDSLVSLQEFSTISKIGLALLVLTFLSYLGSFYGEFMLQRLGIKALKIFSQDLVFSIHRAKLGKISSGDVIARFVSDLPELSLGLAGLIPGLSVQLINIAVATFTLYSLSPTMLLVAVLIIPINYAIYKKASGKSIEYSKRERESLSKVVAVTKTSIDNLFFIKRLDKYEYFEERFSMSLSEWLKNMTRFLRVRIFFQKSYYYTSSIARLIMLLVGGWLATKGLASVGAIVAFTNYLPQFYEPLTNLANSFTYLNALIPYVERYKEIVNIEKEDLDKGHELKSVKSIECKNVSVGILSNVTLELKKNETIGIVGPIGSGKTTLALTLIRLREPETGHILINGKDYRVYSLRSLRKRIYYLPSKDWIFDGTLKENLMLDDMYREDEVIHVLKIVGIDFAELDDYITSKALSEGQKQKIALARALLRKPEVLILDEATNSLDVQNEAQVLEKIREFLKDSTLIIISHRLTALKNADKIFVLNKGKILDSGKHEELYERCSLYRTLVENSRVS